MKREGVSFGKLIMLLLPLAWMGIIFYFSHQPAEQSAELSNGLVSKLIEIFHLPFTDHFVRKSAHFSEYALLGIFTVNAMRLFFSKNSLWVALTVCSFYSVTDEIHQFFIPGRSCQFSDMLLDTAGSAVGIFLWWLIFYNLKNKKTTAKR